MSLENVNIVDTISTDGNAKKVILTIIDNLDWNDEEIHLKLLQEKINNYLNFIKSNKLYETYPIAEGKEIEIQMKAKHKLSENGQNFLLTLKECVNENGFEFSCIAV